MLSILKSRRISIAKLPACQKANLATLSLGPSTTTTIRICKLPPNATKSSLKKVFSEVKCRSFDLEPGCVFHVANEAEAKCITEKVNKQPNMEARVASTILPSVLLNNIPSSLKAKDMLADMEGIKPQSFHYFGGHSIQVTTTSWEYALQIKNIIIKSEYFEFQSNEIQITKLMDQYYGVHVPVSSTEGSKHLIDILTSSLPQEAISNICQLHMDPRVTLRFDAKGNSDQIQAIADKVLKSKGIEYSFEKITRPVLFVRKLDEVDSTLSEHVLSTHRAQRCVLVAETPDVKPNFAILYYHSEKAALDDLIILNGSGVRLGKKLSITYRGINEYAMDVKTHNLTSELQEQINDMAFKKYRCLDKYPSTGLRTNDTAEDGSIVTTPDAYRYVFPSKNFRQYFQNDLYRISSIDAMIEYEECQVSDYGVTCNVKDVTEVESIISTFKANDLSVKSHHTSSNRNVSISFLTIEEAMKARSLFTTHNLQVKYSEDNRIVSESLSQIPSYAVEIHGLGVETSVTQLLETLQLEFEPLQVDRSAIMKIIRHKFVVPTMNALKKIVIDGHKLRIERLKDLTSQATSTVTEYDIYEDESHEEFDGFALKQVMKDYLQADPAIRYQIAKNSFERQLYHARALEEVDCFLDASFPQSIRDEVESLIRVKDLSPHQVKRLFQIYIQNKDMKQFVYDFDELASRFGEIDEKDKLSWSQAMITTEDDEKEVMQWVKDNDPIEQQLLQDKKKKEKESLKTAGLEYKKPEKVYESTEPLVDRNGRPWFGVLIDKDTTQKIIPGGRIASHRVLLMVGNGKGSGGFGMGKGASPDIAMKYAFRDALKRLVHIDLYDNYGFAHDLYGKHNACHVYINATPRERPMVANPMIDAVLNCMGVSSASVKVIGRRNPYSVMNALFNALEKHNNLDTIAKARGVRYLTLRWGVRNSVM